MRRSEKSSLVIQIRVALLLILLAPWSSFGRPLQRPSDASRIQPCRPRRPKLQKAEAWLHTHLHAHLIKNTIPTDGARSLGQKVDLPNDTCHKAKKKSAEQHLRCCFPGSALACRQYFKLPDKALLEKLHTIGNIPTDKEYMAQELFTSAVKQLALCPWHNYSDMTCLHAAWR